MAKKYGVFYDLHRRSDLAFLRDPALDPGDGKGSYSKRDQALMIELQAASSTACPKTAREALIFLIKYLAKESRMRMTLRKPRQRVEIRNNPHFASPAVALEILRIATLYDVEERDGEIEFIDPESSRQEMVVGAKGQVESAQQPEVVAHVEPRFLAAALGRKGCPRHARAQIEEWQSLGSFQPLGRDLCVLPKHLTETGPRRTREDCQYKPRQTGNKGGRPPGSKNKSSLVRPDFFDEMVTVKINGKKQRVTRRIAFFKQVEARATATKDHEILQLLLNHHIVMSKLDATLPNAEIWLIESPGSIRPYSLEGAIEALGGGRLLYAHSDSARMLLDPWVIEFGLGHLGEHRLSRQEQRIVLFFARLPKRAAWPDWWEPDLREREVL
jgi:hypothetical protein